MSTILRRNTAIRHKTIPSECGLRRRKTVSLDLLDPTAAMARDRAGRIHLVTNNGPEPGNPRHGPALHSTGGMDGARCFSCCEACRSLARSLEIPGGFLLPPLCAGALRSIFIRCVDMDGGVRGQRQCPDGVPGRAPDGPESAPYNAGRRERPLSLGLAARSGFLVVDCDSDADVPTHPSLCFCWRFPCSFPLPSPRPHPPLPPVAT